MCKGSDSICLTVDDVCAIEKGLPLQQYDAFVLFADEDIGFGLEMIKNLEGFGLNLCVKERDFLGGHSFEHDAIRHLLTERCDRLVVILSPDFVRSPLNEYTANLAQSVGIAQKKRKIIPCLYKECELPKMFRQIHVLKYQRSEQYCNFWDKLKASLQKTTEELEASPSNSVTDLSIRKDSKKWAGSLWSYCRNLPKKILGSCGRKRHILSPDREFKQPLFPHLP